MTQPVLSLEQQVALCQQIAHLTRERLPLESQLARIAGQRSGSLAESAKQIEQQLVQGKSLADSLASDSSISSRTLAACIEAGQACSQLHTTLERWTSMHLALNQSSKRFTSAMVYPMVLIVIMFISISLTAWNLIPEIQATYALFQHETPNWLLMLATLREHFFWLILAMCLATLLPIAVWFWRRGSVDSTGLPRLPERRLRLQSLASRLASIQIAGSLPLSEVVPRCLTAMGVDQTKSTQAFEDLQARRTLEPLPVETSMLLGSLHGGIIDRDRAIELLDVVSDQFEYQAEVAGGRDARWLPALVAVIVFVVTVATYGLLVYLPWIQLMHRIGQP